MCGGWGRGAEGGNFVFFLDIIVLTIALSMKYLLLLLLYITISAVELTHSDLFACDSE